MANCYYWDTLNLHTIPMIDRKRGENCKEDAHDTYVGNYNSLYINNNILNSDGSTLTFKKSNKNLECIYFILSNFIYLNILLLIFH